MIVNVPFDVAKLLKSRSATTGDPQAVIALDAVVAADGAKILDLLGLAERSDRPFPGALRVNTPPEPFALQIRMRPDQRVWLSEHTPPSVAHIPTSRWLGAAITLYLQDKVAEN